MHHSSAKEDAASKLSTKDKESIVPFEETGRDSRDESAEKDENKTADLNKNERLGAEIWSGLDLSGIVIVVVAAVGDGGGEEEENGEEEETAGHLEGILGKKKTFVRC